jgi:phage-related protein
MATFPSINPSFGQRKTSRPNIKSVRYADGFEQRQLVGIAAHQNPKNYSLKFENITEAESDTIEYFLNERALDQASFTFTPPEEAYSKTGTYSQSGTTITITIM